MKKSSKIPFDPANRRIILDGSNCLDVLDTCQAMCCRGAFNIDINREEFESGKYEAEQFCLLTAKECQNDKVSCASRKYRLKTKPDGSCLYLDDENKCSIHGDSPDACREFICTGGWKIDFDFAACDKKLKMKREPLNGDMVFVPNPLVRVKTIFYSKERKEVTFVKNIISKCGSITKRHGNVNQAEADKVLLRLLSLFDGQIKLKDIKELIEKKFDLDISGKEFDAMVWMLNEENLIVFKNADWSE